MTPPPDELTIGASGEEVRRASEWLDAICRKRGVPQVPAGRLEICLNEVLANVIAHGGSAAQSAPIRLSLEVGFDRDHHEARVTVSDAGKAFDPRGVEERTLPGSLDEASPGGLGLVMIRRLCSLLDYHREGGRNHVTFGTRWKAP